MKMAIVLLPPFLLVGACSNGGTAPPADAPGSSRTICSSPRPQMCTMDYSPVCGTHADGSRATYSNGCTACSNAWVESWQPGECP